MIRLLLGATMISFAGVFVKLVDVGPTVSAFYRMLIGGIALLVVALVRGDRLRPSPLLAGAMLTAAALFAADLFFYHRSILYVGPGLATLLANFQVFLLALVGVLFLGERPRWQTMVSIPMAMLGLAAIVGFDWSSLEPGYRTGIVLGLVTAVCYASYILSLRRTRSITGAQSPVANMALISLTCALMLGLIVLVEGERFVIPTRIDAAWLIAYGLFGQALGWLLISQRLSTVPASVVGLVLLLQPTLAFVWDVTIFGRALTLVEVAGATVALAGIYLGARPAR